MEKVHCLKRFVFLVMTGMLFLQIILQTSHVMYNLRALPCSIPYLNALLYNFLQCLFVIFVSGDLVQREVGEEPQGTDVSAEVTNENVSFEKFPVADLITAIMGEAAPGIIEAVGDVSYKVKYTPTFNDDKTVISMAFTPEPLILEINFPTEPTEGEGEGEGETPDLKVEVTIAAPEAGSFAYAGDKLAFKLQVTGVKVNNEPFELPVTTFSFDLAKAK